MALPAGFPVPPKRPPSEVAVTDGAGRLASAWANYFDAKDRYDTAVRAFLAALP